MTAGRCAQVWAAGHLTEPDLCVQQGSLIWMKLGQIGTKFDYSGTLADWQWRWLARLSSELRINVTLKGKKH